MGLAISAWPKPAIIFPLVKPTPTMKLVHGGLRDALEYKPHRKGPRKAPASAQLMDMSCAMNVIDGCTARAR